MKHNRAFPLKADVAGEGGAFTGYGSVFNTLDSYNERVAPGAFEETLAQHRAAGRMPSLLWQHRHDEPIGVFCAMDEDERGLMVRGELNLEVARGREAYALLKQGALDGLSIGYQVSRADIEADEDGKTFTINRVRLMEVSLVTFPANSEARVGAVKAAGINTIREFEAFLRDKGGYSREAAKQIALNSFNPKTDAQDEPDEAEIEALECLRRSIAA